MSTIWLCVLVVGVATIAIKASGPVLAADRELPRAPRAWWTCSRRRCSPRSSPPRRSPATTQLVLDERAAGFLPAASRSCCRAPLLVVVLVAAATAAGLEGRRECACLGAVRGGVGDLGGPVPLHQDRGGGAVAERRGLVAAGHRRGRPAPDRVAARRAPRLRCAVADRSPPSPPSRWRSRGSCSASASCT